MTKLQVGDEVMLPCGDIAEVLKITGKREKFVEVIADGYEDIETYFINELMPLSLGNKQLKKIYKDLNPKKSRKRALSST